MLHTISLAQYGLAYTRGWAADSTNQRVRLKAKLERAQQQIVLLEEEMRIKDARMKQLPPQRRPHYPPVERMAILELRAARNWSLAQTARAFLVTPATISSWMRRLDEESPDALVQIQLPVNRFPDFVGYVVQKLKKLCPMMGKKKIAETLARAGLHLGATTVGRMLKQKPRHQPPFATPESADKGRTVTAKYPNHLWHVDLTVVPTGVGFWCSWLPMALPQHWPFAWWVGVVVDHFSRRIMGITAFKNQPNCQSACGFLGRTIAKTKKTPNTSFAIVVSNSTARRFENGANERASSRHATEP